MKQLHEIVLGGSRATVCAGVRYRDPFGPLNVEKLLWIKSGTCYYLGFRGLSPPRDQTSGQNESIFVVSVPRGKPKNAYDAVRERTR